MCRVVDKSVITMYACVLVAFCATVGISAPDRTDRALRAAGMLDVLEARLLARLDGVDGGDSRTETVIELARVYEEMMAALEVGSAERDAVVERAWSLADRAGVDEAVRLRMALLIDAYLPIERAVALYEVGLLSEEDHTRHAIALSLINRKLRSIADGAVPEAVRQDRIARNSDDRLVLERSAEAARLRSLSSYYSAWSGLMLSILEDRRPANDVLPAFGWLLAGEGGQPRLDDVRDSAFALDHVARAAIGVARTKHRAGETVLGGMWLEKVIDSPSVSDEIREQASLRRLRFLSEERAWSDVLRGFFELLGTGDDRSILPPGEARFHAMRSLESLRGATGTGEAERVAALALGDLVQRGEIGHVLDLRRRYGALPVLADGFVGRYADALDRLEDAEVSGSPVRYLDAAKAFGDAGKADDSLRFQQQRDDARLKRLYCLIRGGRPSEAIASARAMLSEDPPIGPEASEEARWLLIVGIDAAKDDRRRDELRDAVRAYLTLYRGSDRARLLLVRHAGTDLLEPGESIEGLRAVADDEAIAIDAGRVLVRLLYKQWLASARSDDRVHEEMVGKIRWLWLQDAESGGARQRFDVARIAVDIGLSSSPQQLEFVAQGLERAEREMSQDASLRVHEADLVVYKVEWLAAMGRLEEADAAGGALRSAADLRADRADRIVLAAALKRGGQTRENDDPALDRLIFRVGGRVVGGLIPPSPEALDANASTVVAEVILAGVRLGDGVGPEADIALRLGRVLLERGKPTAQVVRELAVLSNSAGDGEIEMLAWSTLLSASIPEEQSWWEARFHTLRLLQISDPTKAEAAYEQHRVLHPIEGPAPWGPMIRSLFEMSDADATAGGEDG